MCLQSTLLYGRIWEPVSGRRVPARPAAPPGSAGQITGHWEATTTPQVPTSERQGDLASICLSVCMSPLRSAVHRRPRDRLYGYRFNCR